MFHFEYDQEIYDEVKNSKRYYLAWRNQEKNLEIQKLCCQSYWNGK